MGRKQRREKERRLREQFIRPTGTIYHSTTRMSENSGPIFSGYRRRKQAKRHASFYAARRQTLTHLAIRGLDLSTCRRKFNAHEYLSRASRNNLFVFFLPPSLSSFSSFADARVKIRTSALYNEYKLYCK